MKTTNAHWEQWMLPALALLLFVIGIVEHPRALEKMHRSADTWHHVKSALAMMLAVSAAFWIGWRAQWLNRMENIKPHYWIIAAITLAIVPSLIGRKFGISELHLEAGLLSSPSFCNEKAIAPRMDTQQQ
jgi:hypothetical protein